MNENPFQVSARQRGFTLVEMAVSLLVTVSVLLGVLMLFDFSNKLSRVQTNVTDMQQSLRVAQYDVTRLIRMTGRGGLPVGTLPDGTALAVRDNVPAGSYIGGAPGTPEIVPGSDILTVRGVFTAPIYQIASADPTAFQLNLQAGAPVSGAIKIRSSTPTGIPQELQALRDAVNDNRPEGLLLVSPQNSDLYAMVELDPSASDVSNPDEFRIAFRIIGGTHTTAYARFSSAGPGVYPPNLTNAAFLGLVEEYRFYVRQDFAVDGNAASDLTPKLSRARVYPGTEAPYGGEEANWRGDVADNIVDLQIALGLDTPYGTGTMAANPTQGVISETADGENDDWLLNGERVFDPAFLANADLHYVRLNTLARTDRRDKEFQSPELVRIENRAFNASSPFNSREDRMFRRRLLRTLVDVRNL